MGRHTAPELDSPTVVIPTAPGPRPAVTWLDKASDAAAASSTRTKIGALAAVALAGVGLSVLSGAHSGGSTTSGDPTVAARQAGIAYGSELRDAGQSTLSVGVNCQVHHGGYTGAQAEAFETGCADVWTGMVQDGQL